MNRPVFSVGFCVFIFSVLVCGGVGSAAASHPHLAYEGAAYTAFIDRGAQLSRHAHEHVVSLSGSAGAGEWAASARRLTPFGPDAAAFEDEINYSLFYGGKLGRATYGVQALYMDFPEARGAHSLELGAELSWPSALNPNLALFYDTRWSDQGAELSISPSHQWGQFEIYGLARTGFVHPGAGGDFSYIGVEAGLARALSETAYASVFFRWDLSDEDLFVDRVIEHSNLNHKADGMAFGISLSLHP